jgi:hypothetical protein
VRSLPLAALPAAVALLLAAPALSAEDAKARPPASAVTPPVELTVTLQDGKPVCAPAELRLPADTDVALTVVSEANVPVTITAAGQFEGGHVRHADGDLVHVMSEKGYLVKANGRGTLRLRTLAAGDHPYGCTATNRQDAPFVGKLVLAPPAG